MSGFPTPPSSATDPPPTSRWWNQLHLLFFNSNELTEEERMSRTKPMVLGCIASFSFIAIFLLLCQQSASLQRQLLRGICLRFSLSGHVARRFPRQKPDLEVSCLLRRRWRVREARFLNHRRFEYISRASFTWPYEVFGGFSYGG